MKRIVLISLFSVVAMIFALGETQAKTYEWRLQAFMPPADDLYSVHIAGDLVKRIKEATNGQVQITTFPGGALVPPPEIFKSTANGVVQMGYTAMGVHMGFMPVTAIGDGLPMSFRDANDQLTCWRKRGLGDLYSAEYTKRGVHLLTVHCTEAYTVLSSKPLKTQADWRGAKIRGWGIWNKYFGKLNASPVDMPLKDVYMALTMKTIDGCVTGINPHMQLKHYEVCKYGLWPPLVGSALHDLYINLNTWNSLPPDLQKAITKACAEWTDVTAEAWAKFSLQNKENLTSKGVQWMDVDDRAWLQKEAMELWKEVAARDEASAKGIKILTDYLKEAGAIK
jgi:TRAP-type C4-dicarboxylate transport system substrate-binding protein